MTAADRQDVPAGLPAVVRTGTALAIVPAQLWEIAEAAGTDAALSILKAHPGQEICIPLRVGKDHWLTREVGLEAARKICAHYRVRNADGHDVGNVRVYVPQAGYGIVARAKQQLAEDLKAGVAVREAAARAGLSERTARKVLARMRDNRQGELF